MGEKIKDIGQFHIGDDIVKIELNEGYSPASSKYDIHIQGDHIQYYLNNRDFVKVAAMIINAKQKFDSLKSYSTDNGNRDEHLVLHRIKEDRS